MRYVGDDDPMSAADLSVRPTLKSESGISIACELRRHLSPGTVGSISRALPLSGNAHKLGASIVYFQTHLKSGIERSRTEFKRGDIAFYPAEGSICFMHADTRSSRAMSPIGKMIDYADELGALGPGDVLTLTVGA